MTNFLKRLLFFLIPVVIYVAIIFVIDPFNYFKISKGNISDSIKKDISYRVSNPLYELIEYDQAPSPYILLGSSQTGLLTPVLIREYTGVEFSNMSYGGGTLPELVATFWELARKYQLKQVYIGVSFIDFNGSQYRNRIPEAIKIKSGTINYLFSKSVIRSAVGISKMILFNSGSDIGKPDMAPDEFWKFQLDETANRFYANHSYPVAYYDSLRRISDYCDRKKIKLVFFIPPSHTDVQKKVTQFHLDNEQMRFKRDLSRLGPVYDFNFPNRFTSGRSNFSDPFHVTHDASRQIVKELFKQRTDLSIYTECINSTSLK